MARAKGPLGNAPRDLEDDFVGIPAENFTGPAAPRWPPKPKRVTKDTFHAKVSGETGRKRADRVGHFRKGGFVSPRQSTPGRKVGDMLQSYDKDIKDTFTESREKPTNLYLHYRKGGGVPAGKTNVPSGSTKQEGVVGGTKDAGKFAKGGGKWMAGAVKKPGALHRSLGVPQGEKIPAGKIEKASHSDNPTLRKRANLAKTFAKFRPK